LRLGKLDPAAQDQGRQDLEKINCLEMMKKVLTVAFLLFLPLLAPHTRQASDISFSSVKAFLWPEYDRRAVLVNYQFTLSEDVSLPVEIRMQVPRTASFPFKISFQAWDGMLYDLTFKTEIIDDVRWLWFSVPSENFVVEYYDTALVINGQERSYDFLWTADYATDDLELTVQLPSQSGQMRVKPQFGLIQVSTGNLIVYSGELGAIPKDSPQTVSINFVRSSDELTQLLLPLQPEQTISLENLTGRFDDFPILPYGVQVGSGYVVAGLVLFLILFSGITVALITTYRQPRIKPLKGIEKKD
jgi:hypothetical protein